MVGSSLGLLCLALLGQAPESGAAETSPRLKILELELRIEKVDVQEAEAALRLARTELDQALREKGLGFVSSRVVDRHTMIVAQAEALLAVQVAERDEAAASIEIAKLRLATPSPEVDVDRQRAILAAEVRLRASQHDARAAQAQATEVMVRHQRIGLEQLERFDRTGTVTALALVQANQRLAESESWLTRMNAYKQIAGLRLDEAEARLASFENPDAADATPSSSLLATDLEARVRDLEAEIERLYNQTIHLRLEVQKLVNQDHLPRSGQ